MSDIAISVSDVSKCYRAFETQRSRLIHSVWPQYTKGIQEVWALKDINFEIKRGESVAIIGRNGSGKSTLLEILTGTLTPTSGSVAVNGRVSALLELGSGFNPEYSGRDNVVLNGLLLGVSKDEILSRFREIEAFAEIGTAIDRPVKTYSSGMIMRLAFAVQVLCDPDILIIDEALSAGDVFFQQRCFEYLAELKKIHVTLIFVSHDMSLVRDLSQRAVLLDTGHIVNDDITDLVLRNYYTAKSSKQTRSKDFGEGGVPTPSASATSLNINIVESALKAAQWVDKSTDCVEQISARIIAVELRDAKGLPSFNCKIGENLIFRVYVFLKRRVSVDVLLGLKNRYNQLLTCYGTYHDARQQRVVSDEDGYYAVEFNVTFNLEAGNYSIHFSVSSEDSDGGLSICHHQTESIGPIVVSWDYQSKRPPFTGMVGLPIRCRIVS